MQGNARMPARVLHDSNDVCVSSACEIESLHREWLVWTCYQYDCYDAVSVALAGEIERLHGGMV